jgi:peptide/nickel transport system permease protein
MTLHVPAPPDPADATLERDGRRARNPWLSPATLVPAAVVAFFVTLGVWPGLVASQDPATNDFGAILTGPGSEHWFGTDMLGRDVFARVVHGTRYSLLIGLGATAIAIVAGVLLGLAAAIAPRGLNGLLVRLIDILLAFPNLLIALLVITVMGPGPANTVVAVGVSYIAVYARLIRSQVLQVRTSGYVEQAVALGEQPGRIVLGHIVPNAIRPLLVLATIGVGTSILYASTLSFLGLGVAPPTPEWGALVAESRNYLSVALWMAAFPALAITSTVIAVTLLGRRIQAILAKGAGV